jgi:hypothetical protein
MLQLNSQTPWTINANGLAIEVSPQWEQITVWMWNRHATTVGSRLCT